MPTNHSPTKRRSKAARRPAETKAAKNRQEAFRLKVQGHSYREIGRQLGVSHVVAQAYVKAEIARGDITEDERRGYRETERARLETILVRMMTLATRADLIIETTKEGARGPVTITIEDYHSATKAAETVVKISARLAALYGLDAPNKTELANPDGTPLLGGALASALLKAYGNGDQPHAP